MDILAGLQHLGDEPVEWGHIANQVGVKAQFAARRKHRDAVVSQAAGHDHHISGLGCRAVDARIVRK